MRKLLVALGLMFLTSVLPAKEVSVLKIGQAAPIFELPGVDGKTYSLNDFQDAPLLVVIFTCNHCPTAQAYEQRIIDLHAKYSQRGVAFVAISPNDAQAVRLDELGYTDVGDSLEDMKIRAKQRGFAFPYLYDGQTQQASTAYGVLATPHVYIFDAERRLQYVGRIDDNDIAQPTSHDAQNALDDLLAGKAVRVPETRVFGCSTKWADKRPSALEALKKWDAEPAELKRVRPEQLKQLLTEPSDRYRLVNVWATWCVPCIEELDELVTMHRMYRKRDFELITVSADAAEDSAAVLKLLQDKHCSATNLILESDSRDDLFEAVDPEWQGAVPYTVLIAPDGKPLYRVHGEIEALELRREIVEQLGRTYAKKSLKAPVPDATKPQAVIFHLGTGQE